jgi:hypothetical protein
MMTTQSDIITLAIDAYEFANQESIAQAKADEQRMQADYYDKVQAFVHYTLGLEAHIEIDWRGTEAMSAFLIAELGPFHYHEAENGVDVWIEGVLDKTSAGDGIGWVKIQSLADLGFYLRECGYGRKL